MDKETKLALAHELDFSALTVDDISIIDGNRSTFVKYLKAYRFALVLEKIQSVGQKDVEIASQINLLTVMIDEIDVNMEKKRIQAIKELAK